MQTCNTVMLFVMLSREMHIILAAVDIHAGRKRTFEKQPIEQN